MKIRTLNIEHFGSILCFKVVFRSDLIVLNGMYSDQVALAIKLLTGGRLSKADANLFSNKTKLYAEVESGDIYRVEITKPHATAELHYCVYKRSDNGECTKEYLDFIKQSSEEELFNGFSHLKQHNYPHRIKQYKNIEKYYSRNEFGMLTDGLGKTRVFRASLNRFIRGFKPERLREDKDLWLTLNEKGEFRLSSPLHADDDSLPLSETEKVLYHFCCFVHLAEFWSEVERIRNIHRADKPLIISDLIERVDCTVDLTPYIERVQALGRQIFLVYPHISPNTHIKRLQSIALQGKGAASWPIEKTLLYQSNTHL